MSGNKTSLNKFSKIEIISSTFSDHSGMKVEISNRRNIKFSNMRILNYMLASSGSKKKLKGKSKNLLEQMEMET